MTAHQTELHRQNQAAASVRARLMAPDQWVKKSLLVAANDRISRDEDHIARLEAKVSKLQEERDRLALDVADRDARVLAQMNRICLLENLGVENAAGKRPVADIVGDVLADFPGITWKDIISIRRTKRLTLPRKLCMYEVSTQRPDLSYPQIGKIFGGRDHTTIMHSVRLVKAEKAEERNAL